MNWTSSAGLDNGADDYINKPFSPREFQSRINALFRRSRTPAADEAAQDDLRRAAEVQQSLLPPRGGPAGRLRGGRRVPPLAQRGRGLLRLVPDPRRAAPDVRRRHGQGHGGGPHRGDRPGRDALGPATSRTWAMPSAWPAARSPSDLDQSRDPSSPSSTPGSTPAPGRSDYVDAGHGLGPSPQADGACAAASVRRAACRGAGPDASWPQADLELAPGDSLVVVSDGVLDVFGSVEEFTDAVRAVDARAAHGGGAPAPPCSSWPRPTPRRMMSPRLMVRRLAGTAGTAAG